MNQKISLIWKIRILPPDSERRLKQKGFFLMKIKGNLTIETRGINFFFFKEKVN